MQMNLFNKWNKKVENINKIKIIIKYKKKK